MIALADCNSFFCSVEKVFHPGLEGKPVCVGIAQSKTLAKMGSKFAKQYRGYRSVYMIDTEKKRRKALALFDLPSLKASIAHFASSCANKLRGQDAVAGEMTVFILSNRFRTDLPQYGNAATVKFNTPTSDTLEIAGLAEKLLERIWVPGIQYKKSGVIMGAVQEAGMVQGNLFDHIDNRPERSELMEAIDSINHRFGPKAVKLSIEGGEEEKWRVKHEHRSPNYLTMLEDILVINA